MKMKTGEVLVLANAIAQAQTSGKFAPARFGFILAVNAKEISSVAEAFEKSRIALAEQHAEKDADDKPIMIAVEGTPPHYDIRDMQAFNKELQAVAETQVDVKLMTLTLADFPAEFDPALVAGLLPIVNEPEPTKAAA